MTNSEQDFLRGGGASGELIRELDWINSPIGTPNRWPQSLRTAVSICLNSRFPILLWWGPELVMLYNDAYRPILGDKHPRAMGQCGADCWAEIWNIIGPMLEGVLSNGVATWSEDQMLPLKRHGFVEECFFTFTYSPIRDESGGIGGVFCAVVETSERVTDGRRLRLLKSLSDQASNASTVEQACEHTAATLSQFHEEVPFAFLYLFEKESTERLSLTATVGLDGDESFAPKFLDLAKDGPWPFREVLATRKMVTVSDIGRSIFESSRDPWPEATQAAVLAPIARPGRDEPYGFAIFGVSPRHRLDASYSRFFDLLTSHVAQAVGNAAAREEEQKRLTALAELDRAKTVFFSNVSHEFRTPLTLLIGPTEDALASPERALRGEALELVHRNQLRLLKLVNTLLDFARIEAGRVQASFEPTDLAQLTRDLASAFRSAMERGGLRFEVDCPTLQEDVYVDREMWEKIVLNLLSNAFKFTFRGNIAVRLRRDEGHAELEVSDTGVGIAEEHLPRLFERFHRIEGAPARTHEGSGIGLALVHDLVRLHRGEVTVQSKVGQGTSFFVRVPMGDRHLPADRILASKREVGTAFRAESFVSEALRWLPEAPPEWRRQTDGFPLLSRRLAADSILVADDNADMREYLSRLLSGRWQVRTVADGAAALDEIRRNPPALVVADVMMPGLDGLELVHQLRADASTSEIPVMLLSARAGEEAAAQGLRTGADDYVVKPFSASALVVRIESQLALARARREARERVEAERHRFYAALVEAPAAVCLLGGDRFIIEFANPACLSVWGRTADAIGKPILEVLPELGGQGFDDLLRKVLQTGVPCRASEWPATVVRDGNTHRIYFDFVYAPLRQSDGQTNGVFVFAYEVTSLVNAKRAAEDALRQAEASAVEAAAANRLKEEFLGTLSHELRTPLNAIVGWAAMLRASIDKLPGTVAKAVEVIERNARAQTQIIEDVLDISRITTGKMKLEPRTMDLTVPVRDAIEAIHHAASVKGINVELRLGDGPYQLVGDSSRLRQVAWNLLTNAIRHTPAGGDVRVTLERDGGWLMLSVQDTGAGIDRSFLPYVWDRFRQADSSSSRAHGGLGLGLAIVKSVVVDLHGGEVEASSDGVGRGSTFTVRLPTQANPRWDSVREGTVGHMEPSQPQTEGAALLGRRVLLVEDDDDSREILSAILVRSGACVRSVPSAQTALEAFAAEPPELLITDIGMPERDGYWLLSEIQRLDGAEQVPAIALTAFARESDVQRAMAAGFSQHVSKPVEPEMLVGVAADILRRAQSTPSA